MNEYRRFYLWAATLLGIFYGYVGWCVRYITFDRHFGAVLGIAAACVVLFLGGAYFVRE